MTLIKNQITADSIVDKICIIMDVSKKDVLSKTRDSDVVQARQVAIYFVYRLSMPIMSIKKIMLYFNFKAHTSVLWAIRQVKNRIKSDYYFREKIERIKKIIED